MLQYVLLAVFAACAVLCFVARLRVGMLEGAVARARADEADVALQRARWERIARTSAIFAAAALLLCIAVGVRAKMS